MDFCSDIEGISFDEDAVILDIEDAYITLLDIGYYNHGLLIKMALHTDNQNVEEIYATNLAVNNTALENEMPLTLLGMAEEMIIYLFINKESIPIEINSLEEVESIQFALKVKTGNGLFEGKIIKTDTQGKLIPEEVYDPSQDYTILKLREFVNEGPLIVEKRNWTNSYCMVVTRFENGMAYGNIYVKGQYTGTGQYPHNQKSFRLYNRKYKNDIIKRELLMDDLELPFK